eukprot:scaffold71463_cov56-Cyclotella_meneghiniana.AAC.1
MDSFSLASNSSMRVSNGLTPAFAAQQRNTNLTSALFFFSFFQFFCNSGRFDYDSLRTLISALVTSFTVT